MQQAQDLAALRRQYRQLHRHRAALERLTAVFHRDLADIHAGGCSYAEIAIALGVSRGRAQQLGNLGKKYQ